jgi:hypothetical protein
LISTLCLVMGGTARSVDLLECVGADQPPGHLPGDGHHGHRIELGVRDRRQEVW